MTARRRSDGIGDRLGRAALWLFAIAVVAGATHLVSILIMPRLAAKDGYARIAAIAPANRVVALPALPGRAAAPASRIEALLRGGGETAPFEDPALVTAVCRFDLSRGPVRLIANPEPETLLLLSYHSRWGEVFYSMTDRSATRGHIETLLFVAAQRDDVEANDSDDELPRELRIVSPTTQGFVTIRSLAETPGGEPAARKRVAAVSCAADNPADQQAEK